MTLIDHMISAQLGLTPQVNGALFHDRIWTDTFCEPILFFMLHPPRWGGGGHMIKPCSTSKFMSAWRPHVGPGYVLKGHIIECFPVQGLSP